MDPIETPIKSSSLPLARAALSAYVFLIIYASLFPFAGWRDAGLPPLDFLTLPLPHYWTLFDIATNIIGYIPFGTLLVLAIYPGVRRFAAVPVAIAAALLLSGSMEAMQSYLPSRVPSNLDLMTNTAGAAIGAIAGVLSTPVFLDQGWLYALRVRWFTRQASWGMVVLALWPLAQIYPQGVLFGHGQLMPLLSEWLSGWLATPVDLAAMLRRGVDMRVGHYWLAEIITTACGLTGATLALLCLLRQDAPKGRLMLVLILSALTVKILSSALLFAPHNAFAWVTPGAESGILIGLMLLAVLTFVSPAVQRLLAALALLISLTVVNAVPANPYFLATLQSWTQGKFLNFNGAAQFLSLLWPFFALAFLFYPAADPEKK